MSTAYTGVALAAPVSLGYTRTSTHAAPWFVGGALEAMLRQSGLPKSAVDGLAVGSFTLAPDSVVTLTQYYGLEARFLESLPFGGASGIVALRRAARAGIVRLGVLQRAVRRLTALTDRSGSNVPRNANCECARAEPRARGPWGAGDRLLIAAARRGGRSTLRVVGL